MSMIIKKEWKAPQSKGGIAIIGLPGIANTGRIAALTIMKQTSHNLLMDFYSLDMPPRSIIINGLLEFPRVFLEEDPNAGIIVVSGNYQPISPGGQYELATEISDVLAKKLKVKMVVSLAAEGVQEVKTREIKIAGTHKEMLELFKGVTPFARRSITGVNALVPTIMGTLYSTPSACLLATSEAENPADYEASSMLVEILSRTFNWNYDPTLTREVAKEILREMKIMEKKEDYIIAE